MKNKEFIENYIESEVKANIQKEWQWLVGSDLANEEEELSFNPSVIQHVLIKRTQKKLTMNTIKNRYDQLKRLYNYGEEHGQVKFNPFSIFELVSLQQSVDMYYLNNKERYLTIDDIDIFLYSLLERRIQKNTLLNTTLLLVAAYNGIDRIEIARLKISDFDFKHCLLRLPNGSKKPISKKLVDVVKYYIWQCDQNLFFEDYLIAGREQYDNLEQYKKAQKAIVATTVQTIRRVGDQLGFGIVQVSDLLHSGFIRYLKANMNMNTIIDVYSVTGVGNEKNITAMMFAKIVIEYYYRFANYYPEGEGFPIKYSNDIIGKTIGYLYRDKEYYDCRSKKLVEETFR